jgi:hypothetical protein
MKIGTSTETRLTTNLQWRISSRRSNIVYVTGGMLLPYICVGVLKKWGVPLIVVCSVIFQYPLRRKEMCMIPMPLSNLRTEMFKISSVDSLEVLGWIRLLQDFQRGQSGGARLIRLLSVLLDFPSHPLLPGKFYLSNPYR